LGGGGLTKDLSLVELERDMVAGPQYEEQEQELNLELRAGQEWKKSRKVRVSKYLFHYWCVYNFPVHNYEYLIHDPSSGDLIYSK
jgi:hypothetical protein